MKIAIENFNEIRKRLGEYFDWIYKDCEPKEFEVLDEQENEILLKQEFLFFDGKKFIQCWCKKNEFIIKESCTEKFESIN